jgi:hypothetical protein
MDTYTFIAEYKGGTYISQMQAISIGEACMAWGRYVAQNDDIPLKNKASFASTLQSDLAEIPPACLDDKPNVWYFLADAGKGYVHVNVVKTHPAVTDWLPRSGGVLATDAAPGAAYSL